MITLATLQEALNAAKKKPTNRTTAEQALVDKNKNYQSVRNANFDATELEKREGA